MFGVVVSDCGDIETRPTDECTIGMKAAQINAMVVIEAIIFFLLFVRM